MKRQIKKQRAEESEQAEERMFSLLGEINPDFVSEADESPFPAPVASVSPSLSSPAIGVEKSSREENEGDRVATNEKKAGIISRQGEKNGESNPEKKGSKKGTNRKTRRSVFIAAAAVGFCTLAGAIFLFSQLGSTAMRGMDNATGTEDGNVGDESEYCGAGSDGEESGAGSSGNISGESGAGSKDLDSSSSSYSVRDSSLSESTMDGIGNP